MDRRLRERVDVLSGMGPLAPLQTWNGKLFAGLYVALQRPRLILAMGIVIAPIVHRVLHKFHLQYDKNE